MKSLIVINLILAGSLAWSQDVGVDRFTVPFSDATRPGTLKVNLVNGSISVRGYDGKEVIVEARGRGSERRTSAPGKAQGLRRIDSGPSGLKVEEQENIMRVTAGGNHVDLAFQVPRATSLQLKTVNGGVITAEHVDGELDVDNVNGSVKLLNVSGNVVAHALNGEVQVVFDRIGPSKPMSFSSLNGDIDVTLPANTKARLKMKSQNGEIYSDFEMKLEGGGAPSVEDGRSGRGKYRVQLDKTISGTINGGGPDMQFTTLNGKIYIRKGK
jgi:hypothetical protein